jgi:tetratricopeptide (TPR) repeat protein
MRLKPLILLLFTAALLLGQSMSKSEYYEDFSAISSAEEWDRGEKLYTRAVLEYPNEINFHCYLNEMLRKLKKNREALAQITPVFRHNMDHSYVLGCYKWSLIEYGIQKREEKKLEEALDLLVLAWELDHNDISTTLWYGIILKETGDVDRSIEVLERGEEQFDNYYITANLLYSYVEKANLIRNEEPAVAGELYKKALEIENTNLTALLWYGIYLNEQQRYESALEVFNKALVLYPDNEHLPGNINHAFFQYGKSLEEKGKYEKALRVYEEAVQRFPENLYYYYYLFTDYLELDQLDKAKNTLFMWCRAKKTSPLRGDELFAEENNIYYRISDLVKKYVINGDFRRAFSLYKNIRPYFENQHFILNGEGELYWFRGEKDKGIALINRAFDRYIKDHPEYTSPIYINLPMKGTFIVASGNNSTTVMTHAGLARYCFDFMGSNEEGRTTTLGTADLGSNEDYYGFSMPVYSPVDGIVVSVVDDGVDHAPTNEWMYHLEGNHITIQDVNNYNYVFVHNKHHTALVKEGDRVTAGQQIAELGNTASTVPHLHFGVWSEDWTVSIPVRFSRYFEITVDGGHVDKIERTNAAPEQGKVIVNEE